VLSKAVGALPISLRYRVFARSHPGYYFGVFEAADLARRLQIPAITAIEFGVAGGGGLLTLEKIAAIAKKRYGVEVQVVGFDSGKGLPGPADYRDLPYAWKTGDFNIDVPGLKARLAHARLILGDVRETTAALWEDKSLPPIGFISFDLDFYTSTKAAFQVFESPQPESFLPRTFCYFDDVIGPFSDTVELHCDHVGELLAIREFNESHPQIKLAHIHGLDCQFGITRRLHLKTYVAHFFQHPLYGRYLR
jgi:hypothetical protein